MLTAEGLALGSEEDVADAAVVAEAVETLCVVLGEDEEELSVDVGADVEYAEDETNEVEVETAGATDVEV